MKIPTGDRLKHRVAFIVLIICLLLGSALSDRPANATNEVQGIITSTNMECLGITTETDLISWSVEAPARPKDYATIKFGIVGLPPNLYSAIRRVSDGTIVAKTSGSGTIASTLNGDLYQFGYTNGIIFWPVESGTTLSDGSAYNAQYDLTHGFGIGNSLMDPEMVYYSAGYNEQTVAVSGKTTYIKSMALSTANKNSGESNIKSTKSIQFVGTNSGRITSSEDLLVDGSGTWSRTGDSNLCPVWLAGFGIYSSLL